MQINGQNYNVGKLEAMKQLHVARRLGPAIWTLIVASIGSLRALVPQGTDTPISDIFDKLDDEQNMQVIASAVGPLAAIFATMSDADVEYVVKTCMSVVSRQSGESWAPVQTPDGALMFHDIDMPAMVQLVFATLKGNLGNFTGVFPSPA